MNFKIVNNQDEGLEFAKNFLYKNVDEKTILFLSGGKTPKNLYLSLSQEKKIKPGAVALADERYAREMHVDSNEKMIYDTGLLSYFKSKNIPFYRILGNGKSIEKLADSYDKTIRILFSNFPKSVGILGIGLDGHTAGLPVGRKELGEKEKTSYVTSFNNFPGEIKERITMTFLGLSQLKILMVLVFGEDKREALELFLRDGSKEEIPARFFKEENILQKTIIVTDQKLKM